MVILGVSRSGTTLLREMLDRHSRLAIPWESYFIPQLWDRHRAHPDRDAFLDDVGRLERVASWGLAPADVAAHLPERPTFAEAVQAIYRAYAAARGKDRFGDKTPAYMQRLDLLERAFPTARYVHLIRDGRDAALSFVAMKRKPRFNWARPRGLLAFAAQWRLEVEAARAFGLTHPYLELRYEDLVAEPERRLRDVTDFLGLEYEPAMLEYHRDVDLSILVDHPKLREPPTAARSRWREQMSRKQLERFEAIAGDLLAELGYERAVPSPSRRAQTLAGAERAALSARVASWHAALTVVRRSPVWRLRQVYVRRTAHPTSPR